MVERLHGKEQTWVRFPVTAQFVGASGKGFCYGRLMKKILGLAMLGLVLNGCTLLGGTAAKPATGGSEDINVTLTGTLTVGNGETYVLA